MLTVLRVRLRFSNQARAARYDPFTNVRQMSDAVIGLAGGGP